jgi:hypothetical protein
MAKTIDDYEEEIDEELDEDEELRGELANLASRGAWEAIKALISSIIGQFIPLVFLMLWLTSTRISLINSYRDRR